VLRIERASFGAQAWPRRLFLELYRDCPDLFLVAKLSRRIAGYMVTCVRERRAEIESVAVHPEWRRRGVAVALMSHTLRALKSGGVRQAELMVRTSNTAGAALYQQLGFRRTGTVRRYYEDGGDAHRMVRALQ